LQSFSGEEMVADIRMEPGCRPELMVYSAHRQWGGPVSDQVVPYAEANGTLHVKTAGRSVLFLRFT